MKIAGYTVNRKLPIVSVDKTIYAGTKKRYAVMFYQLHNSRQMPIWKDFDNIAEATEYINAIEKLISS